ncbi:MAG: hypothetical protein LBU34_06680 [Planctomycetaceae bacterium]|jgi:hypothetical protein|nr:hypothetical protein [Planctomycetaceae bacterium]
MNRDGTGMCVSHTREGVCLTHGNVRAAYMGMYEPRTRECTNRDDGKTIG